MEYRSLVDTSLNLKPFTAADQSLKKKKKIHQEMPSTFNHFLGFDTHEAATPDVVKQEKNDVLMEELKRVNEENQKLTQMLTILSEKYDILRKHFIHYINIPAPAASNKRKLAADDQSTTVNHHINASEKSSSDDGSSKIPLIIKPKVSRVYVRREAFDTSLTVKDGYQWRKYGQKVTRDNPSPRAYFKCSFAPMCPVKKKVQGSIEDQSIIVATYEGEHKHPDPHPTKMFEPETTASTYNRYIPITPNGSVSCSTSLNTSGPVTITLDLTKPTTDEELSLRDSFDHRISAVESSGFQQLFIQQMASSLTSNPSFKAALAAAISDRSC